jgi:hypothetical protein
MTNEQKVIAAFHEKLDKRISEIDAKDLLEYHTLDKILEAVKSVKPDYKVRDNGIGLIITILNDDGQSKPKRKPKKQEPDETVSEEYDRMVEAEIITDDDKQALLSKTASREVKFAVAKNQYPNHSRLWGRAAGLDVNQMAVFCELDPVQQKNPDWDSIKDEALRETYEFKLKWEAGEITPQTIIDQITDQLGFNPVKVAREMDPVPF